MPVPTMPPCPPLPSHPAQASARTARPTGPSTRSTASMGKVFPLFNQWGSTKYSPPASSSMGGEYSLMAASPMLSARASLSNRSAKGWMAPLPACHGAAMPSCSPSGSKLKGEYSPTAALPLARVGQSDGSANRLMAPMPALFGATTLSLRRSHNFGPAQSAAVAAGKLKVMESISLKIAVAISEGHYVTDGWAVAHLARHLDLLELGRQSVLDALAKYFGQVMNRPGYLTSCLGCSAHADFGSVRAIGAAIDKAMGQRGHTVTLLLWWLLPPAAQGLLAPYPAPPWAERMPSPSLAGSPSPAQPAPFHPQRSMGGSQEGLMAPSPTNQGATKPSMSLAMPSAPARSTTTPTGSSSAPSPPTTTGGGATAAEHRAATTLFCWV
jgi:hypothetical protein